MKKGLLFVLAAFTYLSSGAQSIEKTNVTRKLATGERISVATKSNANSQFKTTGLSDTLNYVNNSSKELFDTSAAYRIDVVSPLDTGYYFGYNLLGTKGYAELFNFDYMTDTTIQIIGIRSLWAGTVQSNSTKTIDFKVWRQGAPVAVTGMVKNYYEGFPDTVKKTQTVSIRNLGIGNANPDTIKNFYFTTPVTGINYNFYVGYEANYNWATLAGDTITLRSTRNGKGAGTFYYALNSANDTFLLARNAMLAPTNAWYDLAWDLGLDLNLSIVPIIQFSASNIIDNIGGIKKNDLTFSGHYPNPAINNTNIKFSLDKTADVTVELTDITGRTLQTIRKSQLAPGEHLIQLETANLAAGNYVYVVRTSNGGAMAAQLTVVK